MNRVEINVEICKECEYCMHFCPKKDVLAKSADLNKKGYYPAVAVNLASCVACGTCATCCPEAAITVFRDV